MKTVIAIDSFKGSLDTFLAGEAVACGVKKVYPEAQTVISPIADGGEGTLDAVIFACNGEIVRLEATSPMGEKISVRYGIVNNNTAVVEIAEAAGITLVEKDKRNPMKTTTYGVGEIIKDAVVRGCREFIVGLGGSVTNDGGVGMLTALGFEFYDADSKPVEMGAQGLEKLIKIENKNSLPELSECKFYLACDVKNPLCGPLGCSAVFAPQKGASAHDIEKMDKWLEKYADVTKALYPSSDKNAEGAGAAGGLGFAFMAYLDYETYESNNQHSKRKQFFICNILHRHNPLSQGATAPYTYYNTMRQWIQ